MSAALDIADIVIRPMRSNDLPMVVGVESGAYEFPWSAGIFRDCLRVGYCCWVLERDHVIDAHCIMQIGGAKSHILNLCVRRGAQGLGLGRSLLTRLLEVARDQRAETALLEVRPTNGPARKLYAAMGFQEVGVRPAYYPDRDGREDGLILSKTL